MTEELGTAVPAAPAPAVGTAIAPIAGARKNGAIDPSTTPCFFPSLLAAAFLFSFSFSRAKNSDRVVTDRRTGKQWKPAKTAFRPKAGTSKSWEARLEERKAMSAMKAREKELKDEKEAARQVGGFSLHREHRRLTMAMV